MLLFLRTGDCKSKTDEDIIVAREAKELKARLSDPKMDKKLLKEYLLRAVYIEMLGHGAGFSHIHAVKCAHESNISAPGALALKKVGYLATTLFLDDQHELILLIVNTLQQDLKNDNFMVVCASLSAICKLIGDDTAPAVLTPVVELLSHPKEIVRKKAVLALLRCWQRAPNAVVTHLTKFRQALCDKDPSVMAASVCAIYEIATVDPQPCV